jgi:hypothetical protein
VDRGTGCIVPAAPKELLKLLFALLTYPPPLPAHASGPLPSCGRLGVALATLVFVNDVLDKLALMGSAAVFARALPAFRREKRESP